MSAFHKYINDIGGVEIPRRFNNPFYYSPHPLCVQAADEVREFLASDRELWAEARKGKMFGVLVVQAPSGDVGYLMAFSGLLFGKNRFEGFVPPVYDMQAPGCYFKEEEARISAINSAIKEVENCDAFLSAVEALETEKLNAEKAISEVSAIFKTNKEERRRMREAGMLSADEEARLIRQSQFEKAELKRVRRLWETVIAEKDADVRSFKEHLSQLGTERRNRSVALQRWLFEQFRVLDANGIVRSILDIFEEKLSALPPAGAGECAGPKLLQYAYENSFRPIALAEFWVGESPVGEIRRDGCFYGACKSKCEPILGHMLRGLDVEESALEKGGDISNIKILFEDEHIVVVDKPSGVLSVPGIMGGTSVQQWLREEYLHSNELFVAHRLDMATSGILVAAKSMEVYKELQRQFANQEVKKQYTAILEGMPQKSEGVIELPLVADYDNRPRQKVDYVNGKPAVTRFNVVGVVELGGRQCAVVCFEPVTGRTHQLRVHSAHKNGLDCPIVGDALYGSVAERLMLHASRISFLHPVGKKTVILECENVSLKV